MNTAVESVKLFFEPVVDVIRWLFSRNHIKVNTGSLIVNNNHNHNTKLVTNHRKKLRQAHVK